MVSMKTAKNVKGALAAMTLALGLGASAAYADIDTANISSGNFTGTVAGQGELFFSAWDRTNNNSIILDLNKTVGDFLLNPNTSVQDNGLLAWLGTADQQNLEWNVAGISNGPFDGGDPQTFDNLYILSTVAPGATPSAFGSFEAHFEAAGFLGQYVGANNQSLDGATNTLVSNTGVGFYAGSAWGAKFGGPLPFLNAAQSTASDMETAAMVRLGFNPDQSTNIEELFPAGSVWSLDLTTGTVNFSAVPVPAAVWFMASAIAGLLGFRRKHSS